MILWFTLILQIVLSVNNIVHVFLVYLQFYFNTKCRAVLSKFVFTHWLFQSVTWFTFSTGDIQLVLIKFLRLLEFLFFCQISAHTVYVWDFTSRSGMISVISIYNSVSFLLYRNKFSNFELCLNKFRACSLSALITFNSFQCF